MNQVRGNAGQRADITTGISEQKTVKKDGSSAAFICYGNDIGVDPESFFNANFANETYFTKKKSIRKNLMNLCKWLRRTKGSH